MRSRNIRGAVFGLIATVGQFGDADAQQGHGVVQPPTRAAVPRSPQAADSAANATLPPGAILDADTMAPGDPGASGEYASASAVQTPASTDHARVVGRYGIGLLGVTTVNSLLPDGSTQLVNVPILGVRHWVSRSWGLQAGFGLAHHSGTARNTIAGPNDLDDPTTWAFTLEAGVPLAFYHDKHYTFLFLPATGFGFASWRLTDDANTLGDQGAIGKAWLLNIGARLGAEIQFGFIDLPMLSLQASVGARLIYRKARVSNVVDGIDESRRHWTLDLETANYNDPWDIFVSSITALYYF